MYDRPILILKQTKFNPRNRDFLLWNLISLQRTWVGADRSHRELFKYVKSIIVDVKNLSLHHIMDWEDHYSDNLAGSETLSGLFLS